MTRLKSAPEGVARDIDCSRNAALYAAIEHRLAVLSEDVALCQLVEGDHDEEDEASTWADEMAYFEVERGLPLDLSAFARRLEPQARRVRPHRTPDRGAGTRLAMNPRAIDRGRFCECDACAQDGEHDPECWVHDEPRGPCSCAAYPGRERLR